MDEPLTATKLKQIQQEWREGWNVQPTQINALLAPMVDGLLKLLRQPPIPTPPWAIHAALVGRNRYLKRMRRLRRLRRK